MGRKVRVAARRKGASIMLRVVRRKRDLIDQAARLTNKTRTDFILDAATAEAENAILDQRFFNLPPDKYKKFVEALDQPPADNPKLRRLLSHKPEWQK